MKKTKSVAQENTKSVAQEPDLQENSVDLAAANMVEKLHGLQDVASKHGFNFLVYMLDMARAEAESLRKDDPKSKDKNSKTDV